MNITTLKEPRRLNTCTPFSSLRTASRFALALVCLLTAGAAVAKQEKTLICHVGNELGSDGATYLENPDCTPPEGYTAEDYVCPDAGKVDLIVVAKAQKHLANQSHSWDGLSDYEPGDVGASGEGTEDSNGDGIDDGCQPPDGAECPCFDSTDLMVVTADNQNSFNSCDSGSNLPNDAVISANTSTVEGLPGTYLANLSGGICATNTGGAQSGSTEELGTCIDLIAARCQEIGSPITN